MIGCVRYRRAYKHLPEHAHQSCHEFCLLEEGHVDWMLGGQVYDLHPGDVFVSRPLEFHGGQHSVMQPCQLIFVQVSSLRVVGCDSGRMVTLRLLSELVKFARRQIHVEPECRRLFRELINERRHTDTHTPLMLRALLNQLLVSVLRAHEAANAPRPGLSLGIARADAYLQKHWNDAPDVAVLARLAGMGRSQFMHRFRSEVGRTPGSLREEQRLLAAKQALVGGGESVTAIAMQLGFSASQYFATWFRRLTGFTPREYRRRKIETDFTCHT
jgi:AraC family L-rhamnose operon regulatory protein RhaS